MTTEGVGCGDEISRTVNGGFRDQHGIILVDFECCPLELSEVIPESSPGPDAIKCAEEDNAKCSLR